MKISLVVPAYNESKRLSPALESLREYVGTLTDTISIEKVLIVNDGSTDDTLELAKVWQRNWPVIQILHKPTNQGKGAAVRSGFEYLQRQNDSGEWILMADADGATDWKAIELFEKIIAENKNVSMIIGSRQHPASVLPIRQSAFRERLGKSFNFILRSLTGLKYADTQCGFKLFKNDEILRTLLPELKVDRFAWDAEIILWFEKLNLLITEVPVRWEHRIDSHVHVIFDSLEMLYSVLKMRIRIARRTNAKRSRYIP